MPDEPFSNREIKEMFNDMCTKLDRIELQTNRTNGRVSSLEVWKGGIVGGISVLTVIVIPLLSWAMYTLSTFQNEVQTSTQMALDRTLSAYDVKIQ